MRKINGNQALCFWLALFFCYWANSVEAQPESLGLVDAVQQALQNDLRVLKAQRDWSTAQVELKSAQRNLLLPQLSLSLVPLSPLEQTGQPTNWGKVSLFAGLSLPIGTSFQLGYSVNLDYQKGQLQGSFTGEVAQPLFQDWSLNSVALELQRKQALIHETKLNLEEIKKQVIIDTLNQYFKLTMTQQSIDAVQSRVKLARQRLESIQSKVSQGQAGQIELLAAQIDLRQNELSLAKLQADYALSQEKFFRSLAWPASPAVPRLHSPLLDLDKLRAGTSNLLKQEGLETKALENAPSVRQAEASVQEAAQNLRTIKQEARPSVALRVSYDGSRGWGLRLDLNHGFFKNFDLQIREAEQALALAQRTLESARETARLEIYSRRDVLRDAQNQMELFSMKQALLRLQEEMRQKQLEGGLLSTDTWEEFLIQKKEFESDYQKAISDLCVSYFEYEKSLGMNLNLEEVILP